MTQRYFFQTSRLGIRLATVEDAPFIHALWTMPAVMKFVGFPKGLAITVAEVREQINALSGEKFGSRLIAELLETRVRIGQCKMDPPNQEGICEPDIKLLPTYWGYGYGSELWSAMIDYAFEHSSAQRVQGTPNRANTASIRMQRGSGMTQVDEGVFANHPSSHPGAIPVPYVKLEIAREQWLARRQTAEEVHE